MPLLGWTDNYIRVSMAAGGAAEADSLGLARLGSLSQDGETLEAFPIL